MLSFIVSEAMVDLRRAGRVGVSAILLITLSLTALGGFWLLSLNLGRAVSQWRDRVRVVVFLREEPTGPALADLTRRVEGLPGVQRMRYVSKSQALQSLRQSLGAQAGVLEHLPRNPLPASIEVTPEEDATTPEATRELTARLSALPEVEDVQGGAEWVEGLARWQRLFEIVGLGVGAVLALAAILTVTTATTLVLHVRRAETEIMRLVGASEAVVRLPQLLQGMVQGLLGAVVALALLETVYAIASPRLEPLL
ncbi:MAG TPA: ABC transporter permease, partial [Methylomirabilota bacterium]|nr:ABC transporter permease [Methylomirabilota bacterium]